MTTTEKLQQAAREAEDEGREVYVRRHNTYDIIEYVEIDGVETYNDDYIDEVKDAYWTADSYQVADHYWRN